MSEKSILTKRAMHKAEWPRPAADKDEGKDPPGVNMPPEEDMMPAQLG